MLLSLGSLLPLSSYFTLPPSCHLHIIDSHRPWNLQNLFGLDFVVDEEGEAVGDGRIWVWGDGDEGSLAGVKKSWEALEYEPSDSGSDSDSEDEEKDEDDEDTEQDDEDEETGGYEDEDGEGSGSQSGGRKGKRRRDSSEVTKKRPRREVDPDKVSNSFCTHDIPADGSHGAYPEPSEKHTTTEYSDTTNPGPRLACLWLKRCISWQRSWNVPITICYGTLSSRSHINTYLLG